MVLKNLSKRLASMIEEDIEFMGPVRMKDVEEAQQKIVAIIRKLEDNAEIVISISQVLSFLSLNTRIYYAPAVFHAGARVTMVGRAVTDTVTASSKG